MAHKGPKDQQSRCDTDTKPGDGICCDRLISSQPMPLSVKLRVSSLVYGFEWQLFLLITILTLHILYS